MSAREDPPEVRRDGPDAAGSSPTNDSAGASAELSSESALREVAGLFLRLGLTAFGGPAAHIAMMRDEVVTRRRWVTDQHFLDLLGATNLIPGPNSTEMAIHLGYVRAGRRGLVVAGALFILPAVCLVLALAWTYVRFGATPQATWLLYGIKPVIIAIVAQALVGLARTAVKDAITAGGVVGVVALYLLGADELALLFGGAVSIALLRHSRVLWQRRHLAGFAPGVGLLPAGVSLAGIAAAAVPFSLLTLFLTFLKIGAVLYGSGYVLLAFLRADFVERLGWLTDHQLLDAVAVGQVTPGPVFTTATFVGYLVGGVPGALLATLAIFLPSFVFVALSNPLIPRIRSSPWASVLLDGVNATALGLMAAVTLELGRAAIVDPVTGAIAVLSLAVLLRFRPNSAWLVAAGGAIGLAVHLAS